MRKKRYDKLCQRSTVRILRDVFGTEGPANGAEIGVYRGQMSEVLMDAFPDLRLTMVDPWRCGIAPDRDIKGDEWLKYDQQHWDALYVETISRVGPACHRCKILRMTSYVAALQTPDASFDFVYIDADHTYDFVKQDIDLWLPKTTRLICGHDYNGKNDRFGSWGVKRAVDERFGDRVRVHGGLVWSVDLQNGGV